MSAKCKLNGHILKEERKEMFYSMIDTKCFIYCHMVSDIWVKDHSYIEIVNLLLSLHGLLFPIGSKGSFICTFHIEDSAYHDLWYINCGAHAGMRNSSVCQP